MKIKINLLGEQEGIIKNEGRYSRSFRITDRIKQTMSKTGRAKLVINTGKDFELSDVLINDSKVQFEKPRKELMVGHWNIPIKITFDHGMLDINGDNTLDLQLQASR